MPRKYVKCVDCGGVGTVSTPCTSCGGRGWVETYASHQNGVAMTARTKCTWCQGRSRNTQICGRCGGLGGSNG